MGHDSLLDLGAGRRVARRQERQFHHRQQGILVRIIAGLDRADPDVFGDLLRRAKRRGVVDLHFKCAATGLVEAFGDHFRAFGHRALTAEHIKIPYRFRAGFGGRAHTCGDHAQGENRAQRLFV